MSKTSLTNLLMLCIEREKAETIYSDVINNLAAVKAHKITLVS